MRPTVSTSNSRTPENRESGFAPEAPHDCRRCPRLAAFREHHRSAAPTWFNAPVPSFGPSTASLLIVGLAPGLKGANRTGRPFTGDYAGDLLYSTLSKYNFAAGTYAADPSDGLTLVDCMITNAVRCVPPENKPTPEEIASCRPYFAARLAGLPNLQAILALGRIAHDQTVATLGLKRSAYPFSHGARHDVGPGLSLFDSFHCSRYNTNTGRLTEDMFHAVFNVIRSSIRHT